MRSGNKLIIPSYSTGFARNAAESDAPELWRGLVGLWCPFLGPTGGTLHDWSGRGNPGTLINMDAATDWVVSADRFGNGVYALDFDGSDDYVNVYSSGELVAQDTISICAWIYPQAVIHATEQFTIFVQNDEGVGKVTHDFGIDPYTSKLFYDNYLPSGGVIFGDTVLVADNWYHACVVRSNNDVVIYLNGLEDGSGAGESRSDATKIDNTLIGARYYGSTVRHRFDGIISEICIYNRALSAAEIRQSFEDPYGVMRERGTSSYTPPLTLESVEEVDTPDFGTTSDISTTIIETVSGVTPGAVESVKLYEDGVGYTDYTAEANDAVPDDTPLLPHPYSQHDALYIGGAGRFDWIYVMVSTAGVSTYDLWWEYWDGDSWDYLETVLTQFYTRDENINNWETLGEVSYIFDVPDDWTTATVDGDTLFWVRARGATVGSQTTQPLAQQIWIALIDTLHLLSPDETLALSDAPVLGASVPLSDTQTLSDALAFSANLPISDSLPFNWAVKFNVGQVLSDSLPLTDSTVWGLPNLNISDSLAVSDNQVLFTSQPIIDILAVSDDTQIGVSQSIADALLFLGSVRFGVSKWLSDTLSFVGTVAKSIVKPFWESQPLSDLWLGNISSANWIVLGDVLYLADEVVFDVGKSLQDNLTFLDAIVFDTGAVFADIFTFSDRVVFDAMMQLLDTLQVTDSVTMVSSLIAVDQLQLTDGAIFGASKIVSDNLALLDGVVAGVSSVIADNLSLSDGAVFGAYKLVSDSLPLFDTTALGPGKLISDSLPLFDAFVAGGSKPISDNLPLSDDLVWPIQGTLTWGLQEILQTSEAMEFFGSKPITDSLGLRDDLIFDIGPAPIDQLLLSDTQILDAAPQITDQLQLADSHIFDVETSTQDILQISDQVTFGAALTILDLLNITDTPLFLVGKVITDQLVLTDTFSPFNIFKSILDVLVLTDAIELNRYLPEVVPQTRWALTKLAERQIPPYELHVAIGESDVEGTVHDTELWDEVHRKKGTIRVVANTVFVRAVFGQDEPTADDLSIKEVAIFDAATGGTLIERWVLGSPSAKDNVDEVVVECALTIVHGDIDAFTSAPDDVFGMTDKVEMVLTKG